MSVSATIDIGLDPSRLTREMTALLANFERRGLKLNVSGGQGFSAITRDVNSLEKSLEQAERRTIAFAATSASVYAVSRAMKELFKSTVEVEKTLVEIGVVLGRSGQGLQSFGRSLFDIARNTAQSFGEVSKAALEFSRQGLSVQETLKRTNAALILTRQSGLDVVSSTEAITAALNTFNGEIDDSILLVNKLANVDAAFAVSSADLVEGLKRVGATARDAGVSLDETIGLITSLQQTTARGGSNIGNSLKSIFERGIRPETLAIFDKLGAATVDSEGNLLSLSKILENVAQKYKGLDPAIKQVVVSQAGGVYQANALRSLLRDLSKETSIYEQATRKASTSVDEAIKRNEQLNVSLSALLSRVGTTVKQVGAEIGDAAVAPGSLIRNALDTADFLTPKESDSPAKKAGEDLAKGLLKGLGSFLGGPGAAIATAFVFKLGKNLAKNAFESVRVFLDLGKSLGQNDGVLNSTIGKFESIRQKVQSTNDLLVRQSNLLLQISKGTGVQVGSLFSGAGTPASRGRGGVSAGAILSGSITSSLGGSPTSPFSPTPLITIPQADTSFTKKELLSNIFAQNPSLDKRAYLALNVGNALGGATKQVSSLLKSLQQRVTRDPSLYSAPQDRSNSLKSFELELSNIVSSTGGILGTRPGQEVFTQSATAKASSILGNAPSLYTNVGIRASNQAALDAREQQRQQFFGSQLIANKNAARELAANQKAAQAQRARSIGSGLLVASPLFIPAIDERIQSAFFDNKSSPSSRATSAALSGLGNAVGVGTTASILTGGNVAAGLIAGGLTLGSGLISAKNQFFDKKPELLADAQAAAERVQEITVFLDTVRNIQEEIDSTTDPEKLQKLLKDLSKTTNLSRFGAAFNRGGTVEIEALRELKQAELISASSKLALQSKDSSPVDISSGLLAIKSGGQTFEDFLRNSPELSSQLRLAGQNDDLAKELGLTIRGGIGGFGSNAIQDVFDFADKDGGFRLLAGGITERLQNPSKSQTAEQIGQTNKEFRDRVNRIILGAQRESLSRLGLNERGAIGIESSGRIGQIVSQAEVERLTSRNADPFRVLGVQRQGELSSIQSQAQARSRRSQTGVLSSLYGFGLGDLEELKNKGGSASRRSVEEIEQIRSLLSAVDLKDRDGFQKTIDLIQERVSKNTLLSKSVKDLSEIQSKYNEFLEDEANNAEITATAIDELDAKFKALSNTIQEEETRGGIEALYKGGFRSNDQRIESLNRIAEREIKSGTINSGQQFGNIGRDFLSSFSYQGQDFFLEVRNGAIDTARTIKSEFSGAFKEFARGTKDAGSAFRDFALNIALNVQDKIIDIGVNSLLGSTLGGLGGLFKSKGGSIQKFSDGGLVTGGSGLIDDVPAKLAPGDFVMQRSAVSKYGIDSFSRLNNGVDISLSNSFNYDDPRQPSAASSASVSPYLSNFALEDDNNPQNILRSSRLETLRGYLGERDAYELQKVEALKQFEDQKRQQLIGTYISAGLAGFGGAFKGRSVRPPTGTVSGGTPVGAFGYGSSQGLNFPQLRNTGGQIFGNDSARDTVPAYLTAGEFVIKGSQAARIGYRNLEAMNQGMIPRFAYGGSVGGSFSDSFGESLSKLISLNEQLNQSFLDFASKPNNGSSQDPSQANTAPISVVVNINTSLQSDGAVKSDSNSSSTGEKGNITQDNIRQFDNNIRALVQDEIVRQSRPGGLLTVR